MNRRGGYVLIGLTLAVVVVLLVVSKLYYPVGLLEIAVVLFALIVVLMFVIFVVSRRKQAV
jgi:hypothetical protein